MMQSRRTFLLAAAAMLIAGPAASRQSRYGSTTVSRETDIAAPSRLIRDYPMPYVALVDQYGQHTVLQDELQQEGPVLMNFIFTTCPGICPILSATFSRTAALLGNKLDQTRLWSISVDPDYDTPERLLEYGKQYQAPRHWQFFTGQPAAIKSIRDAFDTDSDNKMAHQSLVLLRTANNTWIRLEGTIEPELLVAEVYAVLSS